MVAKLSAKIPSAKSLPISPKLLSHVYKKEYLYAALDSLYLGSSFTDYRRYHTLDHIAWCLNQMAVVDDADFCNPVTSQSKRLDVEAAILFHDAVCIPGSKTNELLSADIAMGILLSSFDTSMINSHWVSAIIRNTGPMDVQAVKNLTPLEQIVRDIDHSILGSTWETYERYADNVRAEYGTTMIPEWMYNKGRLEFLADMMERAEHFNLFTTPQFRKLNPVAFINMTKERYQLTKSLNV